MTTNKIDNDWLMVEHYRKLPKKENPYDFGCILCSKTHFPKDCQNRKTKEKPSTEYQSKSQSLYQDAEDGVSYGW
jgi:hypothetical protein